MNAGRPKPDARFPAGSREQDDRAALVDWGCVRVGGMLSEPMCQDLLASLTACVGDAVGLRTLLSLPPLRALAVYLREHPALAPLIPPDHVAVQCTYFEKSQRRNWLVPPHQDLSIPVAQRVVHPRLQGWSQKAGVFFVQPPPDVLQEVLAVRVHLDPCGLEDGPLWVIPATHVLGRLDVDSIARMGGERPRKPCLGARGDAWVMRPLLVHTSSKASGNSRRRVLHFLFGPRDLPYGLRWRDTV